MRKIIIAGGSGFLGRTLNQWFEQQGCEVVTLSRSAGVELPGRTVCWDGMTAGEWVQELEGAAAIINLAGRSVNCRYHARNRRQIMDSRVASTRVLGQALAACDKPPQVWIQSSTATIYKHNYGEPWTETSGEIGADPRARDQFSIEVAQAWEEAFEQSPTPATRRITARTAMVFGAEPGGVYHVLRWLVRLGLGGAMDGGRQMVSWIHAVDFCRVIDWLITQPEANGVFNVCAPEPLQNHLMMQELRSSLRVPIGFPQPRWLLIAGALLMRTEIELVVKSRNVVPERLQQAGFEFRFRNFAAAAAQLAGYSR